MRYRQPRSINVVSIFFLLVVGLGAYVLVCLWPVYTTSSQAKGILRDYIPSLYNANLRPDNVAQVTIEKIKTGIASQFSKIGINDKNTKIVIHRSPKEISIEAYYKLSAHFPFPDRTFEFNMSPTVTSDATRIDW